MSGTLGQGLTSGTDFDIDQPWPMLDGRALMTPQPSMAETLAWVAPERRMPDAELRVLLWIACDDGTHEWDCGHWDGEHWVLHWCGAPPAGRVVAWAQPEGPGT